VLVAYQGLPLALASGPVLLRGTVVALLLLLATRWLMRREGRPLAELGLSLSSRAAACLLAGLAGGALLFGAAALLLGLWLPIAWQLRPAVLPQAVLAALAFHFVTNACEELAWRGYAFDGFVRSLGHWPAQAIVALASACFHVLSGWSWQVALVSTTAGSLLFVLVFLRWRSVPAAIGVHMGWNWMRDLILSPGAAAAVLDVTGPAHWSRGDWQLAQAVFVGVTLLACGALLRGLRAQPLLRT
jgi:membrane protease YdiL (CAAX protease family)